MKLGRRWANGTAGRWSVRRSPLPARHKERLKEEPMAESCSHVNQIKFTTTDKHVCEDCIKTGDTWVHLRLCLECGHVGCCDSSKNKHATKHFHRSEHPLIRSIEPGEAWIWCYVDEMSPGELAA
jgi:uncharacterized UBP type Zn finger protein